MPEPRPEDRRLERDGVALHFVEWTPGHTGQSLEPPVLLLHGLSSNARYWDRVASHLPDRRLVALDQRGHGLTGRPPHEPKLGGGFAMTELVDDAVAVIDSLDLGRPVVVGHSWGATVALELAATRPEKVSGLVFIDGPVQSAANLFSWDEAQKHMQPPLPRFARFDEAVAASKHDFGGAWGDDLEPFVRSRVVADGESLVLTLTSPIRLELLRGLYDSQPDLLWANVGVPAVALLAMRNYARTTRFKQSSAERLHEIAPHVAVRWFDTPHDIPLYMPREIAGEIEGIARLAADFDRSETPAG